jgi:hypothetical protein
MSELSGSKLSPAAQLFDAPQAEQTPVLPSQPQPQPQPQLAGFSDGTAALAIGPQQDELLLDDDDETELELLLDGDELELLGDEDEDEDNEDDEIEPLLDDDELLLLEELLPDDELLGELLELDELIVSLQRSSAGGWPDRALDSTEK